jgi:hypothetical protein
MSVSIARCKMAGNTSSARCIAPCQLPRFSLITRDERFERRTRHAEQTSTFLKVEHCAVSASQSAGLGGDLRNVRGFSAPTIASVLGGDWTDRFPDYGFHSFQERLDLIKGRPRQIAESWSYGAECLQASRENGDQRSSEIHCGTGHGKPPRKSSIL